MRQIIFSDYARTRLGATVFAPDFEREDEQLFAASLASTESILASLGEHRNANGAALSVLAGFVETMTPNAFADRHGDSHVIGMHAALLVTIADFALYAFTQRGFLPAVGNADAETSPPPAFGEAPGLFLLDRTLDGGAIDADADRHRVPNDARRHETAIYLAVLMARFVWLHEWAHCALGHVDYLKATGDTAHLHEVPDPQTLVGFRRQSSQGSASLHAMELEADHMAFTLNLQIQLEDIEPLPGIQAFDRDTRIEMATLAAWLMAWLFEEYQRHMDTRNAVTHPAPRHRLQNLSGATANILSSSAAHNAALHSFTALRVHIPAMPKIATVAPDRAALDEAVAPYRYVRA